MNDFKNINKLTIYKNLDRAGLLERTPQGCEFHLYPDYVKTSKLPYFTYCIPNSSPNILISGDNLPPFFAGLLPEGRRLNALISKVKTSNDDLFSLFAAAGSDCIGDIYVGDPLPAEIKEHPRLDAVNFYAYFEELIDPSNSILDNNSLAGVQEKISASMISFPLNIARKNKSYILKLNPKDKNNLIQNELHCLQLAKKCGFTVPKAKIVIDKDSNYGLLIERFDRINQRKLHQEDACQFLNRYPADKYRISINQIADALLHITNAPQLEILNLLCQYAFSYLICNGDLHAKNISLQTLENGIITLTPLYDLICTAIYSDFRMALKIDGRDDNIKRKTFITFAERYNISKKAINSAIDTLLERFIRHHECLYLIEMPEKRKNLLNQMISRRVNDLV
ncbi:type II toxin-antitoxin system HipA family toxin [Legionella genomosp. 1]|uniref:type II toxin-antitoxin system HipA family toxin n=1 Tax=Legionella genomosp. 1 TaxID=1093625 RepID=UPI0010551782|nr:HipA domain-containing protein [Legionella genomosp. 1]